MYAPNQLHYVVRDDGPVLVATRVGGLDVPSAIQFEFDVREEDAEFVAVTFAATFGNTEVVGLPAGDGQLVARNQQGGWDG